MTQTIPSHVPCLHIPPPPHPRPHPRPSLFQIILFYTWLPCTFCFVISNCAILADGPSSLSDASLYFKPYWRQSMHAYSALSAVCTLSRSLVLCATTLLLVLQPKQTYSAALVEQFYRVSMLICVGAYVCMCVCMYVLRIVSLDKILPFVNTLIIVIYLLTVCHSDLGTAVCIMSPRRHSLTVFGGSSWHDRKDSRCQHRLKRSLF